MANDLMNYLAGKDVGQFMPRPHYSREGDFLTFFFRDDEAIAERIDELLTVYLSAQTRELVGAKIKGVQRILSTLGSFGVTITDEDLTLGMLFLAGMAVSKDPAHKNEYVRIGELARSVRLDPKEFQPA